MHRRKRGAPPIGNCTAFLTSIQQAMSLILLLFLISIAHLLSSAVSDFCWRWPCRSFEKSNHDREANEWRLVASGNGEAAAAAAAKSKELRSQHWGNTHENAVLLHPLSLLTSLSRQRVLQPQPAVGSHRPPPFLVVHFATASYSSARGERYDNESYVVLHLRFVDRKDFIGGNQQSWPFLNRLCRNNKFLTTWRPAVERTVGELEFLRVRQNAINAPTTSSLLAVWQKANEGSVVPTQPSATTGPSITTTISLPTTTSSAPTPTTSHSTTADNQTSQTTDTVDSSSASFLGAPFEFQAAAGNFSAAAEADGDTNITNTTAVTTSNSTSSADGSTTTAQVKTTTTAQITTTAIALSTTSTTSPATASSSAAATSTRATSTTTPRPPTPTAPSDEASEPIEWDDVYPPHFLKPYSVPHFYSESCTIYNTAHDYYRIFKPLFGQSGKGYPASQQGTSPSHSPSSTAAGTTTAAGLLPTASTTGLPPTTTTTIPGPTTAPEPTVSPEVLEELRRSPHIAVRLSSGRQPVLKLRGYAGGHAYDSSGVALTTLYAVTIFVRGTKEALDTLVASWSGIGPDVELNKYYREELGIVSASILGDPAQLWGPIDDPANWPSSDGSSQSNAAGSTGGQASENAEALIPDVFWSASYASVADGQGLSIGWVVIIVVGMLLIVSVGTILYHRREGKKGIHAEAVQGLTDKAAKRRSEKSAGRSVERKRGSNRGFLELSEEYINTYVSPGAVRFAGGSAVAKQTDQSAGDLSAGLLSGGDFVVSDNDDDYSDDEGLLSLKQMEEYEGHLRENDFEGHHEEEEEVPQSWRVPDLETELAINIVRRQQATKMAKATVRRQQRDEEQRRLLMSHGMEEPILNHSIRRLRRKEEEEKASITTSLIQRTLMPKTQFSYNEPPSPPMLFPEDDPLREEGEDVENPHYTIPNVDDEHMETENDRGWSGAEDTADVCLAAGGGGTEEGEGEGAVYNQGPQDEVGETYHWSGVEHDGKAYAEEYEQPHIEFNGSREGELRSGEWEALEMHDIPQHGDGMPHTYMEGRGRRKREEREIAHPTGAQWSVQPFLETLSIDESFRLPPLRNADGTIAKRALRGMCDSNASPSSNRRQKSRSSPRGPRRKKRGEEEGGIERLDRGEGKGGTVVKRIGEIEFVGAGEGSGGGPLASLISRAWSGRDMDGFVRSSSESSENNARQQRSAYLPTHSHRSDDGDERDVQTTEGFSNAARRAMMEELEKDLISSRLGLAARRKMNEIRDVQSQVINTIVLSQKGIVLKPEQYKAFDNTTAFNRLPTSKFAFAASRFPGWNHVESQNTEAAAKSAGDKSEEISSNSAKNIGDLSASTDRSQATAGSSASSSNPRDEQHDKSAGSPIRKRVTSVPDLIATLRAPSFVNAAISHPQPATADPLSPTFSSSSSLKSSINGVGKNTHHGSDRSKLRSPASRTESAIFGDSQATADVEKSSPLNDHDAVDVWTEDL